MEGGELSPLLYMVRMRIMIYSRKLPLRSQSYSRNSSLCVCARVPFVHDCLYTEDADADADTYDDSDADAAAYGGNEL